MTHQKMQKVISFHNVINGQENKIPILKLLFHLLTWKKDIVELYIKQVTFIYLGQTGGGGSKLMVDGVLRHNRSLNQSNELLVEL